MCGGVYVCVCIKTERLTTQEARPEPAGPAGALILVLIASKPGEVGPALVGFAAVTVFAESPSHRRR